MRPVPQAVGEQALFEHLRHRATSRVDVNRTLWIAAVDVAFGRIFAVRPSLADRQLHTKYRTFFPIGSHVLGRCRPKPDRRLTVAKTATLSQLKHLLRCGRIAYRSISSSFRSSSRPVNPMIVPSLAPFDVEERIAETKRPPDFRQSAFFAWSLRSRTPARQRQRSSTKCNLSNHVRIFGH